MSDARRELAPGVPVRGTRRDVTAPGAHEAEAEEAKWEYARAVAPPPWIDGIDT